MHKIKRISIPESVFVQSVKHTEEKNVINMNVEKKLSMKRTSSFSRQNGLFDKIKFHRGTAQTNAEQHWICRQY